MHSNYRQPVMRQLRDQQVRFVPRNKKLEQAVRAEKLLTEIVQKKTYSYEYLCYRVTDFRPVDTPYLTMSGEDASHDIRLFVEDLSDSANMSVEEADQPVMTVDDLSKRFKVSTKTISRWRQLGLVSRRFIFNGRKRVGFLQSSVEFFINNHEDRIKRGERFSQLSSGERKQIIERARRLARSGGCPSEVTKRIAKRMTRSVETIRYTLKQFDQEHPEIAIFPDKSGPLSEESKQRIYQHYRRGTSVEALAKKNCRTKTSIYRIVNEMRAIRILDLPLDYIPHDSFDKPNVEKSILGPLPEPETKARKTRIPSGLPPYLASLYEVPLLTREQEQHLFRKFNFLKHQATKLRSQLDPNNARSSEMDRIEEIYDRIVNIKNQIVQANLRLVVSIAKRHLSVLNDFFELVSDGNMSLIRAVEKFDFSRGNKFSTYSSWAIMKNYARSIPEDFKHRDRFRTSHDEMFGSTEDNRTDQIELESAQQQREYQVSLILSRLDEREQKIIISRFGLDHNQEPQTLKEVGAEIGVTKERVRQIEVRALNKLRLAAQEKKIDALE